MNTAKDTAVKPAKLSRGRAPNPLLPLGCKRSKKATPCATAKNTSSDKEEESVSSGSYLIFFESHEIFFLHSDFALLKLNVGKQRCIVFKRSHSGVS